MLTGGAAAVWMDAKLWLIDVLSLSKDALHVHLALAVLMLGALAFRCRPDRLAPWLIVVALTFANEAVDLALGGDPDRRRALAAAWHDIANTLAWPTTILLAGRWLWPERRAASAMPSGGDRSEQPFE